MDHVVHVVEHVEVGVLPEMIRWPFHWVPRLGEIVFSVLEDHVASFEITWYERHLQDLSGQSMGHRLQQTMHLSNHQEQSSVGKMTKSQLF